jgi:hypothetical protein
MQRQFRNRIENGEFRNSATDKNIVNTVNELIKHVNGHARNFNDLNNQLKRDLPSLAKDTATTVITASTSSSGGTAITTIIQGNTRTLAYTGNPIYVAFDTPFNGYCNGVTATIYFDVPDTGRGNRIVEITTYDKNGFYVDGIESEISNVSVKYTAYGG